MNTWRVAAGSNIDGLKRVSEPPQHAGPGQVRIRLKAASLNFRDLMVVRGWYPVSSQEPLVPGSDGVGEVIETGPGATRFQVGDRVATSFFPEWVDGPMSLAGIGGALGGGGVGTLAEEFVLPEHALIASPKHLSDAEAATLTCAGVTAWNALFETANLRPGQTALLLGTGGVSIWALQLAKAAGARVIITSSSDAKLERAKSMGADATINYTRTEEWGVEARKLNGGEGVDVVLEVGGEKTIAQSLAAVRMQGTVAIIGGVSGMGGTVHPRQLIVGATRMNGVFVGSRRMHENLARFVGVAKIRPVVDRAFDFGSVPEAYRYFEKGQHFGKVCVSVG